VRLPGSPFLTGVRSFRERARELVGFHVYFAAAETDSLRFQTQPLFNRGISAEFDCAACPQHALPGESEAAAQDLCDLAGGAGESGSFGNSSIGADFAAGDGANGALDAQKHRAWIGFRFSGASRTAFGGHRVLCRPSGTCFNFLPLPMTYVLG